MLPSEISQLILSIANTILQNIDSAITSRIVTAFTNSDEDIPSSKLVKNSIDTVSGNIPTGSSTDNDIQMDGTKSAGNSSSFARANHVHPTDTSRAASSHTHGNLQNDGQIGLIAQANKNVVTDGEGKIITENKPTIDSSLSDTSTNAVQNKVVNTALGNKVDKETGKGLSTNDYTTTEKNKLAGIDVSANNYSHPSYVARTGKPTANQTPGFGQTATVSQIKSDTSGHVTEANDFTIKIPSSIATTSAAGLMSSSDKEKLDGIATGANNITVDSSMSTTSTNPVQNKIVNSAIDTKTVTVEKQATAESGYTATYVVKQNGTQVGEKINIPKDFLVKSATMKTCSTANSPLNGLTVGDPYLDFVINSKDSSSTDEHIYINVKDLVDTYTAGTGLNLSNSNQFSVKLSSATNSTDETSAATPKAVNTLKTMIDNIISGETATDHNHDGTYEKLSNKIDGWSINPISDANKYPTARLVDDSLRALANQISGHNHNSTYVAIAQGNTSDKQNKNLCTDSSGNVTLEDKDNHTHKIGSNANYFVVTTTNGVLTSKSAIGNIDVNGAIGQTSGRPIKTTTNGVLETGYERIVGGTIGGTTSAFTATVTALGDPSISHGRLIALYNNINANDAGATLKVGNLAAKPIYYKNSAITAGQFPKYSTALFMYNTDSSLNSGNGVWQMIYAVDTNTNVSHTHGALQNGGTISSAVSSLNNIVVTDTSNYIKTSNTLPLSKIADTETVEVEITYTDDSTDTINLVKYTGS